MIKLFVRKDHGCISKPYLFRYSSHFSTEKFWHDLTVLCLCFLVFNNNRLCGWPLKSLWFLTLCDLRIIIVNGLTHKISDYEEKRISEYAMLSNCYTKLHPSPCFILRPDLTKLPRLASNLRSSCLIITRITGVYCCTCLNFVFIN